MKTDHDIKLGVSLYSYQDNYYFHRFDTEGCIAAAADAGAEGFEIFSDAMIPEWPYVTDRWIDTFNGWKYRYNIESVCLDHFSDRAMWHDRQLTDDELYERGVLYIKTAARLGCKAIRVLHDNHMGTRVSDKFPPYRLTDAKMCGRLLPVAAKYNILLALECHAPGSVADPCQQEYLEIADKMGLSEFIGLQADFSSYEYRLSMADIQGQVRNEGCTEEVLLALREAQTKAYREERELELEEVMPELEKIGLSNADKKFLNFYGHKIGPYNAKDTSHSYETLKQFASSIKYVHGKFYYIDEDGEVDNMDYHKILGALKEGGYKGYICSEFEGNRRMNDAGWCNEIEYVRKHHVLMRKCLGYPEPVFD
jgi:sugar phosphate isomerase/epimerase